MRLSDSSISNKLKLVQDILLYLHYQEYDYLCSSNCIAHIVAAKNHKDYYLMILSA